MTQAIPLDKSNVLTPVDDAIRRCINNPRLVIAPAHVLETECHEITHTPLIHDLYDMMTKMMLANGGIGLAAPQVGLPIRFIVVKIGDDVVGMLNPEIIAFSKNSISDREGCLSVPGHRFSVPRHSDIFVDYWDVNGDRTGDKFVDLSARCIQHEIDHLNGITIIQSGGLNRGKRRTVIAGLRTYKSKLQKQKGL